MGTNDKAFEQVMVVARKILASAKHAQHEPIVYGATFAADVRHDADCDFDFKLKTQLFEDVLQELGFERAHAPDGHLVNSGRCRDSTWQRIGTDLAHALHDIAAGDLERSDEAHQKLHSQPPNPLFKGDSK